MKQQAKNLKEALKSINATANHYGSDKPSVKTIRKYIGNGQYEWREAVAHTDALTPEQVAALKEAHPYYNIRNFPQYGFAIIKTS